MVCSIDFVIKQRKTLTLGSTKLNTYFQFFLKVSPPMQEYFENGPGDQDFYCTFLFIIYCNYVARENIGE